MASRLQFHFRVNVINSKCLSSWSSTAQVLHFAEKMVRHTQFSWTRLQEVLKKLAEAVHRICCNYYHSLDKIISNCLTIHVILFFWTKHLFFMTNPLISKHLRKAFRRSRTLKQIFLLLYNYTCSCMRMASTLSQKVIPKWIKMVI